MRGGGGKWGEMGGNGGEWGEMEKNGEEGGKWGEMGENGGKWRKMGENGGKWGRLVQMLEGSPGGGGVNFLRWRPKWLFRVVDHWYGQGVTGGGLGSGPTHKPPIRETDACARLCAGEQRRSHNRCKESRDFQ